jgi:hypothetical protein
MNRFGKGSLPLSELKARLLPRKRQVERLVLSIQNKVLAQDEIHAFFFQTRQYLFIKRA